VASSVPWWQDPAIRLASSTTIVPSIYQLLVMCGIKMPWSQDKFTPFVVTLIFMGGGVVWIVRRVKRGNDPNEPAPKVTLTSKPPDSN
jgi:hypothetical protein